MKISSIIVFVLVFLFHLNGYSQHPGYKAVKDSKKIEQQLKEKNINQKALQVAFKQEKTFSFLNETIKSEGIITLSSPNKLRIEYNEPNKYLLIFNNDNVYIKDEKNTNQFPISNNKTFKSIQLMMIDCLSGNLFKNPKYITKTYESGTQYLIDITPKQENIKNIYDNIIVKFNKNDLSIANIQLIERSDDKTIMSFMKSNSNPSIKNEIFTIY